MKLYHGSNVAVQEPKIIQSNRSLDFGAGFYVTSSKKQAIAWAKRQKIRMRSEHAIISSYIWEKENTNLNILHFEKANKEWLDFVSKNRKGIYDNSFYDIVIGAVADDRTVLVINEYMNNLIPVEEAILRLKIYTLEDQYAFLTDKALKSLIFKEASEII